MSCAELMYHQNLSSGFPYHHQRSITDAYYSSYNSVSTAACSDYHAQAAAGDTRMLQPLGGEAPSVPAAVSSEFASSPSLSLGLSSTSPQQHLGRGDSRLSQSLPLSPPCAQQRPAADFTGGAATSSSSSPSSSSPSVASASTLSPSLSYFPPSSSAFTSRPPTQSSSVAFSPAPASFFAHPTPASSSSLSSSHPSALKRRSAHVEDPDDVTVPKKTRYVTSNCVVLTYHEKETSSEVDDHFSKALSSSSPCGYGSGASTRHSSADSPPMSQRNFPPSFWDAAHPQHQYPYNYQAFPGASHSQSGFLAPPHDALYPLPAPFLSGSLGTSSLHHPLSPLHKDPWAGFPFASGSKSTLNYYPYSRAVSYPDPHALSVSYGSVATGANSSRLSSNYSSLLLPTSSVRSGHFPSATITSAQCATEDLGARVNSLAAEHSRNPFGSGSVPGSDSSVQAACKDLHWF